MDTFDDEHTILRLFDFSADFALELAVSLNFARLQRAPEGSKQSTRDRCNQIIDGCGMGFTKIFCSHSIMLGNRSMHTEYDRFGFAWKLRVPDWPLFPLNMRLRYVSNFSHGFSPCSERQRLNSYDSQSGGKQQVFKRVG